MECGQTRLTCDNKLSSSDGQRAGTSCPADLAPDICCDKSQSETGDRDTQAAIVIERARVAVGTESVPRADFDNLQAVVRQIADQMKWFTDKVSEDMAEPDRVVDATLDAPEDESEPVLPVGVGDESQGIILNDLQACYADNESVAANIDPQLSNIIGNLTKARLPEEKLKAKLDGYTRPGNCPTLVDTRVNPEIWDKLSPPTHSRDIKCSESNTR